MTLLPNGNFLLAGTKKILARKPTTKQIQPKQEPQDASQIAGAAQEEETESVVGNGSLLADKRQNINPQDTAVGRRRDSGKEKFSIQ